NGPAAGDRALETATIRPAGWKASNTAGMACHIPWIARSGGAGAFESTRASDRASGRLVKRVASFDAESRYDDGTPAYMARAGGSLPLRERTAGHGVRVR